MTDDEIDAAVHVGATIVTEVSITVEDVHRAILRRVRAGLTPLGRSGEVPITAVEGTTAATYAAIRGGAAATATAAVAAMRLARAGAAARAARTTGPLAIEPPRAEPPPTHQAPPRADPPLTAVRSALAAAIGDTIEENPRTRALAPAMTFDVTGWADEPATAPVVVFVHGLAGTPAQWDGPCPRAALDNGASTAVIGYNTGLPIFENGTRASALLHEHLQPFHGRIILVGHSLGGLVLRSALHQGRDAGHSWIDRVDCFITLGTPHGGAPLEKVAHAALSLASLSDIARPIAQFGNKRSRGIKDLRFGAILPDHWTSDPDETLFDETWPVPLPAHIHHHAVVATLGGRHKHPLGVFFGDGMVRWASATAQRHEGDRRVEYHHVDTGHMQLMTLPEVADLIAAACHGGACNGI